MFTSSINSSRSWSYRFWVSFYLLTNSSCITPVCIPYLSSFPMISTHLCFFRCIFHTLITSLLITSSTSKVTFSWSWPQLFLFRSPNRYLKIIYAPILYTNSHGITRNLFCIRNPSSTLEEIFSNRNLAFLFMHKLHLKLVFLRYLYILLLPQNWNHRISIHSSVLELPID